MNKVTLLKKLIFPIASVLFAFSGLMSISAAYAQPVPKCVCAGCGKPCGSGHKKGCPQVRR